KLWAPPTPVLAGVTLHILPADSGRWKPGPPMALRPVTCETRSGASGESGPRLRYGIEAHRSNGRFLEEGIEIETCPSVARRARRCSKGRFLDGGVATAASSAR